MCNRVMAAVRLVTMLLVISGTVWAQDVPQRREVQSPDVFEVWYASLNDTADRTLAAALADRPWMKASGMTAAEDRASSVPVPTVRIRAAVERVQRLRPIIEPILRQEGVPSDLSAVVLVESGGHLSVSSPKGARGAWQFMPDTARRYGLAVEPGRDERVDLEKSTRAAARYLRDLFQQFGDWRLALAAYNAGEQSVQRAAQRTRDFTRMGQALPEETRKYVPAVLSAMALFRPGPLPVNSARKAGGMVIYAEADSNP